MKTTNFISSSSRSRLGRLFAVLPLALGLAVLAGAHLFPSWTVRHASALAAIGLNSALCFVLCGAGLLASRANGVPRSLAGAAAAMLAAAVLLQPLLGYHAESRAWQHLLNARKLHGDPALWPGSMHFGPAVAFLCAGLALLLEGRLRGKAAALAPVLASAVTGAAMLFLFSSVLGNVLFDSGAPLRPLVPAAAALGLAALGLGLFFGAPRGGLLERFYAEREDRRIFVTGLALFSLVSLMGGLAGVGIVGRYAMVHYQDALRDGFTSNTELFRASLDTAAERASELVRLSGLEAAARAGGHAALQRELERIAAAARFSGLGALKVVDARGRTLALAGSERFSGQFSVLLPSPAGTRLYWQDGWHVLATVPLAQARAGGAAAVLVDVALVHVNRRFAQFNAAGLTAETAVCSAHGEWIDCFPSRLHPLPWRYARYPRTRVLAMNRALAGAHGVSILLDYRGKEVLAAFGRMEATGLGLVQKTDADEFYRPLRRQLWYALLGITLLIVGGASVLYWRTRPLVAGLVRTRARLDAILDNVPAGVLTFGADGVVLSANRGAAAMFGYSGDALLGMALEQLVPGGLARLAQSAGRALELAGRGRAGEALALEVICSEFMLGEQPKRIAIVQDIGQRRQMEQAVLKHEASLANAQRIAHIGNWELDVARGAYAWSDETFRIFGLAPAAEAPGYDAVLLLVHPEDRIDKQRALRGITVDSPGYDVSFRLLLPDGRIKVLHAVGRMEFDGAGRMRRLRGTVQDVTEITLAAQLARKRKEEYRALVENLPDVVVRFDRQLRCVYVNPAIWGAPGLQDVIAYGRTLDETGAAPRHVATWAAAVRRVLATQMSDSFELSVPGGHASRHYQVLVVPELRRGGEVHAVLAMAHDITAIRNGEAVLRENEQRLVGITANIPGMVFQCAMGADGALAFTYASEGVAELFGVAPAAIIADSALLTGQIVAAERAGFYAGLAESARAMAVLDWEGRAHGHGGRAIWINCRATPRRAGGCTVWDGVIFNITASKRNAEQLTGSRQLLRELSAHMESAREEERKGIAREVHDELGQALTALRMDVSLVRLHFGGLSPALLERIGAMKEAVDRTIGIVRNVTSALRPAALDLGLTAALEWQVEEFGRRSRVDCVLHTGAVEVVLDDSQATALFRIVQESLTNVLKHAGATEVEVTIEYDDDQVRLEVCDNGAGFAADAPRQPGKFGLMGVRERVLMLGGTVDIQSAPQAGTCVLVRLPITAQRGAPVRETDD